MEHVALQAGEQGVAVGFDKQLLLHIRNVGQQPHKLLALLPKAGDQRIAHVGDKPVVGVVGIKPARPLPRGLLFAAGILPKLVAGV